MTEFTPVTALAGGLLIGASAVLLLWMNGRIAGISGIVFRLLPSDTTDRPWRWVVLLAMLVGALVHQSLPGVDYAAREGYPPLLLVIGGLLVGFGTRVGNGCTSGHGVCGLGRRSGRSLVATAMFMATAVISTYFLRHVWGIA